MNAPLAVFILLLTSYHASAAPAPQQFQPSHGFHHQTQSLYPFYNLQPQPLAVNTYSNLLSQPAFGQNPFPVNPLPLNSSDLKKIESDYQAALEKIKKENEANRAAIKLNSGGEDGSKSAADQGSANVVNNPFAGVAGNNEGAVVAAGNKGSDFLAAPPVFGHHQAVDPIFGPEIGSKYEIHYSPEHLSSFSDFSAPYAGYPVQSAFPQAQPAAFSSYSAFPTYSEYPNFGGSNPFLSVDANSLNGNKIEGLPSNPQQAPGVQSYPGPVASSEPTTEAARESSSESDIGAPPSIDNSKQHSRAFPSANHVPARTQIKKT